MGKILEPKIEVDDIIIQMDTDNEYNVDRIINEWGRTIPMIKIGDYVLQIGQIISCSVKISINKLPTFDIVVNDDSFRIRENLKNQLDFVTIFFGYKKQYIKFNGIVSSIDSGYTNNLTLSGIFYNNKLYENSQKIWNDTNILNILKDVCSETNMGLFTYDNDFILNTPNIVINPNLRNIEFIEYLIKKYTDNIFCFDTYGYLHIGNIENILKQPIDKYSINPLTWEVIDETDIILRTRKLLNYEASIDDKKLYIDSATINSNFSLQHLKTFNEYFLTDDLNNLKEIVTNKELGFGNKILNTFQGFKNQGNNIYPEIVNKILYGNLIKLKLRNICYEIVPFTNVNLELYIDYSGETGKKEHLDETHSGKHTVVGYDFVYKKKRNLDSENSIEQILYLI